jgi:CRISPR-associated protein Csx16
MTTYLVTRHEGTRRWAKAMAKHGRLPFTIDRMLEHLDPSHLKKGDVVVGTLPIHMAAELRRMGVVFWSLDLHVPPRDRGKELSGVHVYKYGAQFTRYDIRRVESTVVEPIRAPKPAKTQPSITLIPVSDQLAPAAIGWRHAPTEQVCLLASSGMKKKAALLKKWFEGQPNAPSVAILPTDDANYGRLLAQAEDWANRLATESRPQVVVNLTGGTKPMSLALQRAFSQHTEAFSGRLSGAYVDTSHRQIDDLLASEPMTLPMKAALNIEDQLALQGFDLKAVTSALPGYERWLQRERLFKVLMEPKSSDWRGSWYALLESADKLLKNSGTRKVTGPAFSSEWIGTSASPEFVFSILKPKHDAWYWKGLRKALEGSFGTALRHAGAAQFTIEDDQTLRLRLEREPLDELAFLAGGWMEAWLSTQFRDAHVDDFAQGLEVKQEGVKNELDLVVACGNRLLMVEVKTGRLNRQGKEDRRAVETLYKLDSVAEKMARLFSERWLVSLTDIDPADRERAAKFRIKVFAGAELQALPKAIRDWTKANRLDPLDGFSPSSFSASAG